MISTRFAALSALLALAACNAPPATAPVDTATGEPPVAVAALEPAPSPTLAVPTVATARPQMSAADKGEKGARAVLLAWARALELGDYDTAFAQWGAEAEARSQLTRAEHAAYWSRFKTISVAMPTGTMEGAMGSSYYEAPTTVIGKQRSGKPYRLVGTVTLRRVNDVAGATPDQLHWHIEQVDLKPVT